MAVDVRSRIEVNRPRDQVAAFLEDPANDHRWIRALVEPARVLTDGPFGNGTRVRRVARMAGAKLDYTTEVVEFRPSAKTVMKTVTGPPMVVTYSLADSAGGTEVTVRNEGGSGLMFRLFGWLVGRMVRSRVDGDLRRLKQVLEQAEQATLRES